MTQCEQATKQCEYIANVFAVMFPASKLITCDLLPGEQFYVCVAPPGSVDYNHYTMMIDGYDDDYCFKPDDDNEPPYQMPIRFPNHTKMGAINPDLTDDGSIEADDVITAAISR